MSDTILWKQITKGQRAERSVTQMTLAKMIARLKELPPEMPIENLKNPHSYRGYYSDLAFERGDGQTTVGEFLKLVEGCLGGTFIGWKGGEFKMDKHTPVFIASQGVCGVKLKCINDDATILTEKSE